MRFNRFEQDLSSDLLLAKFPSCQHKCDYTSACSTTLGILYYCFISIMFCASSVASLHDVIAHILRIENRANGRKLNKLMSARHTKCSFCHSSLVYYISFRFVLFSLILCYKKKKTKTKVSYLFLSVCLLALSCIIFHYTAHFLAFWLALLALN